MKNRCMAGEGHTGHDALRPHRAGAAAHERLQVDALGCVDGVGTHTINHHKYNHANTSLCAVAPQANAEQSFDE
jgi:hypothetical protein